MAERYSLGIVEIAFRTLTDHTGAADKAAALGFDFIDIVGEEEGALSLPVVDRFAVDRPHRGWSTGAPPEGPGRWDKAVQRFRAVPGSRIEPWGGSIINSVEKIKAFLAETPETLLLLDTGHVACWGEDPGELVQHAGHIQLRQARRGVNQALALEGDIDFAEFIGRLRKCDYQGALSIEYFDLPEMGLPLDDPVGYAVALADQVRPLL
jgi:sugar phosphate isomerase/epimerase